MVLFIPFGGYSDKEKSVFADLTKKGKRYGKTVKTSYFTHNISYSNPEANVFNFKIDWFIAL